MKYYRMSASFSPRVSSRFLNTILTANALSPQAPAFEHWVRQCMSISSQNLTHPLRSLVPQYHFGQFETHFVQVYMALPSTVVVLKTVSICSRLNWFDASIRDKSGDCIDWLAQAGRSTLPLLSIALAGQISWQTKQSSGHPASSFSGQVVVGNVAAVTTPPNINRGPYSE